MINKKSNFKSRPSQISRFKLIQIDLSWRKLSRFDAIWSHYVFSNSHFYKQKYPQYRLFNSSCKTICEVKNQKYLHLSPMWFGRAARAQNVPIFSHCLRCDGVKDTDAWGVFKGGFKIDQQRKTFCICLLHITGIFACLANQWSVNRYVHGSSFLITGEQLEHERQHVR